MLAVLHGAKRNVGDFLIRDRALSLLHAILPEHELVLLPRWQPIPEDIIAAAHAVVLAGGPGLAPHFYPRVFPLTSDIRAMNTPVLPLALGWSGRPKGHPEQFNFDASSTAALEDIHSTIGWSSVRDELTADIMRRANVGMVEMTGCVAWYDLDHLGRSVDPPSAVGDVVVTTPASVLLAPQCGQLLRAAAARFPDARKRCVFHRGIEHAADSKRASSAANRLIRAVARRYDWEIVDAAGDLDAISFYSSADLHIGYRVHAHLAFLSAHRPSLLLEEDGRAAGQAVTLHPDVRLGVGRGAVGGALEAVEHELDGDFPLLRRAVERIEATAPTMRRTIEQLR